MKQVIRAKGWIELKSTGCSMFPLIREQDLCRFHPCDEPAVRRGDILLFHSPDGHLIAHRCRQILFVHGERRFRCQGDANGRMDDPIAADRLIGRLVQIGRQRKVIGANGRAWKIRTALMLWLPSVLAWPRLQWLLYRMHRHITKYLKGSAWER